MSLQLAVRCATDTSAGVPSASLMDMACANSGTALGPHARKQAAMSVEFRVSWLAAKSSLWQNCLCMCFAALFRILVQISDLPTFSSNVSHGQLSSVTTCWGRWHLESSPGYEPADINLFFNCFSVFQVLSFRFPRWNQMNGCHTP